MESTERSKIPRRLNDLDAEDLLLAMAPSEHVFEAVRRTYADEKESDTTAVSFEEQELLAKMVQSLWNKELGPSKRYLYRLVKNYIEHRIGGDSVESETLMELFIMGLSIPDAKRRPAPDDSCHVAFRIQPRNRTPLLHIRIFPHHNDIALRFWEAGAVLAEYFLENPDYVVNKRVVELGAGVGTTGLVLAGCCGASHVYCTDYTEACLVNMRHNFVINRTWLEEKRQGHDMDSLITAEYLEWSAYGDKLDDNHDLEHSLEAQVSSKEVELARADVLLAADVCYDHSIIGSLVRTVRRFLTHSRKKFPNKLAIFATTIRSKATFDLFQKEVKSHGISIQLLKSGLDCNNLPLVFPMNFVQPRSDVMIYSLSLGY